MKFLMGVAERIGFPQADYAGRCGARTRGTFGEVISRCLEPVDEPGQHCTRHSGCYACERGLFPGHRHISKLGGVSE
jgi:hypothetical protein